MVVAVVIGEGARLVLGDSEIDNSVIAVKGSGGASSV
jgi:hypothetical protein